MTRKRVLLALMWTAALAVVVLYQWFEQRDLHPRGPRGAGRSVVHTANEPPHHVLVRPSPQAALPEGPPACFGLDRRHTGRSGLVGPAVAELAFRHATGARISAQVVGGADGRLVAVSHDHFLYVLEATGNLAWTRDLGEAVYSTPFVDRDGAIYVGSDANVVFAFGPDGDERFRVQTGGDADTGFVEGPDGTLYFAAGNELWAMDKHGHARYRFRARGKIFTTPAVDDASVVYFGAMDDSVYAVGPDGRMRWSFATRGDVDASPMIGDDGTVYVGSDDRTFYALAPSGTLRWSVALDGMVRAPASIGRDGSIYVPVFGPRPRVVALDPTDGRVRWEFAASRSDGPENGIRSGVLVDREGQLYFGAHDDYVYAITPRGELRWTFELDGDVEAMPVLTPSGLLAFASESGVIYALRVR